MQVVFAVGLCIGIALSISGCGGGGSGGGPSSGCSAEQWQCSNCTNHKCLACNPGYVMDPNTSAVPGGRCIASCIGKPAPPKPGRPATPFTLNGQAWPEMCIHEMDAHFFGIGDWGGNGPQPGCTWQNPGRCQVGSGGCGGSSELDSSFAETNVSSPDNRPCTDADYWAQKYVAEQMKKLAPTVKPDYVINVGDNFYPGGIGFACGAAGNNPPADPDGHGRIHFDEVYGNNPGGLDGKPWMSVLGNHDYGGYAWFQGWDQQIFQTWNRENWIMPGQFWHRKVQYEDFKVHYFFLESNFVDANDHSASHWICQHGSPGQTCWGVTQASCQGWLNQAWQDSIKMVENELKTSDAEWHIIVTHFPAETVTANPAFQKLNEQYSIDLVVTGHAHYQRTGVDHGMHWIITGGGGGVTTDSAPHSDGHDDAYGFIDFSINHNTLKWDMHTWGGEQHDMIISQSVTINSHKSKKAQQLVAKDETSQGDSVNMEPVRKVVV